MKWYDSYIGPIWLGWLVRGKETFPTFTFQQQNQKVWLRNGSWSYSDHIATSFQNCPDLQSSDEETNRAHNSYTCPDFISSTFKPHGCDFMTLNASFAVISQRFKRLGWDHFSVAFIGDSLGLQHYTACHCELTSLKYLDFITIDFLLDVFLRNDYPCIPACQIPGYKASLRAAASTKANGTPRQHKRHPCLNCG